jgi:hypothetical protein
MEDEEVTGVVTSMTNGGIGEEDEQALISNLRQLRADAADLYGKTKVMDVPGYHGMLGVEFQYISSEVTEKIAREVRRETKNVNGQGVSLLSSLDTLIAASKNVLKRAKRYASGDWLNEDGTYAEGVTSISKDHQVNFRSDELARILDYDASDPREVVIGLYGSEHKIIQANVLLSQWLTDKSRTADEDFLG